jgi:hypothetical protein
VTSEPCCYLTFSVWFRWTNTLVHVRGKKFNNYVENIVYHLPQFSRVTVFFHPWCVILYSHQTTNNFPEPQWPTEFRNGQGLWSLWGRNVIIIYFSPFLQATKALRESRESRGEGSASRPGRFPPPGKTRYPLYRRLGGPRGWSGQVRKISPPPGFDPRTIQPVASCYTDWATRPTIIIYNLCKCIHYYGSLICMWLGFLLNLGYEFYTNTVEQAWDS